MRAGMQLRMLMLQYVLGVIDEPEFNRKHAELISALRTPKSSALRRRSRSPKPALRPESHPENP